jgi:phage FluMu gp28-like protein
MTSPRNSKFFLPYQANWIRDTSRLKIYEKSRQIGISWASAYEDVANTGANDARYDSWISSRDIIQARLYLEDCTAFASILHKGAQDLGEQVLDDTTKTNAYVLAFANGKRIHSMSSSPDAQAGKRGSRKLDEYALNPDNRKLYAIAYPGITWGGSMAIISTHRGTANHFNELVQEIKHKGNPKGFSLHTTTLQDALDQGFLTKLKAKLPETDERQSMDNAAYFDFIRAGCPDEETFQQEYMCVPSDDSAAFLSYDLITSCEYKPGTAWEKDLEDAVYPLYIGVDVGRKHDLTVIWVLEKVADTFYTRKLICMQNRRFAEQEQTLYPLLALPQVRRCCIDNTGIGRQFAERAQERFGVYKVEAVNFTGPVKEELAYPVRAAFEDITVRVPADDFIRADLRAIKKETTASGNVRFTADHGKNGHADRFWALALAMHAGANNFVSMAPQPCRANRISEAYKARRMRACMG